MEEPVRKSLLDYVRETKPFSVCRLIFCAKIAVDYEEVMQLFDTLIKEKYSKLVTGLLLVNSEFIIHLLESSEDDIFQLCNEVFSTNPEILTNVKCLFIQNDARKRFFKKWYSRRINDCITIKEMPGDDKDDFETISAIHKTIIMNLLKFYNELWDICFSKSYEDFIKQLDFITKEGHPHLPDKRILDLILNSRWGYDLIELVKDYCNLKYPHEIDDCSSVSDIIRGMHFDINEYKQKRKETAETAKTSNI